ncbi:transposase [Kibdelosporangium philippinense]|uniref:Transposase n=2 Tax=Kibdelosporangium philippinense TaxID=211113 RepID=A0ABS8ZQR7_9PSEU|nr:transposase [Kibdelosporangium philippinense]
MCAVFKAAVAVAVTTALPHATLVVDNFHVVQLANAVIDKVRARRTVQARGRRGRSGDREWDLRNKLKANVENRSRDTIHDMVGELADLDEIGPAVLAAWVALYTDSLPLAHGAQHKTFGHSCLFESVDLSDLNRRFRSVPVRSFGAIEGLLFLVDRRGKICLPAVSSVRSS